MMENEEASLLCFSFTEGLSLRVSLRAVVKSHLEEPQVNSPAEVARLAKSGIRLGRDCGPGVVLGRALMCTGV